MRLFIAIELPAELKIKLGQLRTDIPGVRWVPPEQIHLTLAFLGDVDEETVERLTTHLADIRASAFKLSCGSIGCFPGRQQPRVVWIGVTPEPGLLKLAAAVQQSALYAGIPLEVRPFSPHLTLARLKLPASAGLRAFLDRQSRLSFKPFAVHEFTLFQSRLTSQGAVHSPVRNFPLIDAGSEVLC
jgi:2'-5' RNA ligase